MLDADSKAIQQINFTGNLDLDGSTTIFFIIEEVKNHSRFFTGTVNIVNLFCFDIISK